MGWYTSYQIEVEVSHAGDFDLERFLAWMRGDESLAPKGWTGGDWSEHCGIQGKVTDSGVFIWGSEKRGGRALLKVLYDAAQAFCPNAKTIIAKVEGEDGYADMQLSEETGPEPWLMVWTNPDLSDV